MRSSSQAPSQDSVALRDYVEVRVDAAAKLEDTRWAAHADVHALIAEALRQAQLSESLWRANANEWRGTVTDLASKFVTIETADAIGKRVTTLEQAHDRESGRAEERQRLTERRALVVGLSLTALTIVVNVLIMLAWHR